MSKRLLLASITVCTLLAAPLPSAAQRSTAPPGARVEVFDLGTPYAGGSTEPQAINASGAVVGTARPAMGGESAFIWTRSDGFTIIAENAVATDINERSDVVGWTNTCYYACPSRGFIWNALTGLRDLGEFQPYAINAKGSVAGACYRQGIYPQPCVLIDGSLRRIEAGPTGGIALDVNNRDQVVGFAYRLGEDGGAGPEAFTWSSRDGVRILERGATDTTEAAAVNNSGAIAGTVAYNGTPTRSSSVHAALWERRSFRHYPGPDWTMGSGINERGWSVGVLSRQGGPNRPFMWADDFALELPAPAGLEGWYAADVNNAGWIVGAAYNASGETHAVLWRVRRARAARN
jgi:uncharacterized membrane protein